MPCTQSVIFEENVLIYFSNIMGRDVKIRYVKVFS